MLDTFTILHNPFILLSGFFFLSSSPSALSLNFHLLQSYYLTLLSFSPFLLLSFNPLNSSLLQSFSRSSLSHVLFSFRYLFLPLSSSQFYTISFSLLPFSCSYSLPSVLSSFPFSTSRSLVLASPLTYLPPFLPFRITPVLIDPFPPLTLGTLSLIC